MTLHATTSIRRPVACNESRGPSWVPLKTYSTMETSSLGANWRLISIVKSGKAVAKACTSPTTAAGPVFSTPSPIR